MKTLHSAQSIQHIMLISFFLRGRFFAIFQKFFCLGQFGHCGFINIRMTNQNKTQEYINTEIAGNFLGLSVSTMKRMRRTGEGPLYYKLNRSVRYKPSDLREWALKNQKRSVREFLDI